MGWGLGAGPDRRRAAGLAQANPLLPLAVLRQARARATPSASANGPKACMRRCAAAPEIIVSHAHMDGERELRPSPLIAGAAPLDWTPARPAAAEPAAGVAGRPARPAAGAGRPWRRRSGRARHAGAQPLWAFVRHRLGGRAMAAYADVAAISVRGQFLHRALELAWGMLPDQDALHAPWPRRGWGPAGTGRGAGRRRDPDRLRPALKTLECERARRVLANGWTWRRGACRSPSRRSRRTSNGSAAR